MRPLRSIAVLALGILAISFCGAQAPAATASSPEPTVLHITTNLVQLDVVVTDKGKAVHDLAKGRFHIFEDGREQTIFNFDEHRLSEAEAPPASMPVLPPNTYTNATQYPQVGAVNVMLLDGVNTPIENQTAVRSQMIEYVNKMKPGTMIAIFTLGSQLEMIQGFTTDGAQLARVLQSPKAIPHPSVALDNGMAQQLRDAGTINDQNNPNPNSHATKPGTIPLNSAQFSAEMNQTAADTTAQYADQQVQITLTSLGQLARYLAAIPGRKNLIWFSGSFPIELTPDSNQINPGRNQRTWDNEVREMGKLLSVARVAVYPVYALGPQSQPTLNAAYKTVSAAGYGPPPEVADDANGLQDLIAKQGTMKDIAYQTGGQYSVSNGLKEAMANAVENGASYYTISYVPTAAQLNGKFRNIKVSLDKADYNLAYRRGYYADPPDKKEVEHPGEANLVTASAVFGAPQAAQVHFQARVLPAADPQLQGIKLPEGPAGEMTASLKGPAQRYIVEVTVDPRDLTFEETPDGARRTEVDYVLSAYGADAKRVNYLDHGIKLNMKPEQYARIMDKDNPRRLPPHRMAIDLPAGQIALRVVVYDPAASRAGSLEIPLEVAASQVSAP